MASVLYDLRMICWLFVWRKSEVVRSGVGVVENLELGVILAEGKSYLFSPVRDKIWWLFRENTLPQRKKAPDVEIGCLVLFVTQSFPRRDFPKAASA